MNSVSEIVLPLFKWSAKLLKLQFSYLENKGWIRFFWDITFCDLAILRENGNVTKRWCVILQRDKEYSR